MCSCHIPSVPSDKHCCVRKECDHDTVHIVAATVLSLDTVRDDQHRKSMRNPNMCVYSVVEGRINMWVHTLL